MKDNDIEQVTIEGTVVEVEAPAHIWGPVWLQSLWLEDELLVDVDAEIVPADVEGALVRITGTRCGTYVHADTIAVLATAATLELAFVRSIAGNGEVA